MIRDATPADLPVCLEMARKFHAVSGLDDFIPFDDVSAMNTASKLMDVRGLLVMGEPPFAMAGVFAAPSYWNTKYKMAAELFWWVEPEHRGCGGALMDALEVRAREMGATLLDMSCLEKQRPEVVGSIYVRRGYTPIERHFYRSL